MSIHKNAGKQVEKKQLSNIAELISLYYESYPNMDNSNEIVAFGTSGHRGSSLNNSFTEEHIIAISQAICDYRKENNITGPLFIGKDTHALSTPAEKTALSVFAANQVQTLIAANNSFTPTPVISHAILTYNKNKTEELADGVVITPSHNPPDNGGFKYNPPNGGPADTDITSWIADRANSILRSGLEEVNLLSYNEAIDSEFVSEHDYISTYVNDLENVIDMEAISKAKIKICADALGGSGFQYWEAISKKYNIPMTYRNDTFDPTFSFMCIDHDGKVRMDCSSPYAMASLIDLKNDFDIAFGNDPDFDRHGIVTKFNGLMNPNHYLAVAINYLFSHRPKWPKNAAIGKTLVSSSIIDKVAKNLNRSLQEVPVGFKWFVNGLLDGSLGFGGEESAGASFLRKDGTVWSTDKDGIILSLLSCEILAVTSKDPGEHYYDLTKEFGTPVYERIDAPATPEEKAKLKNLSPEKITSDILAGDKIISKLSKAPANNAPLGGIKVITENGWFAARPSGTENIYKIYAESFKGKEHLLQIQKEAKEIVNAALEA
jgi:phosphoglucomutase